MRTARLLLLLAAPTFLGAACEDWPLFAHLPEEDPGPGAASQLSVTEDAFLPDLTIQGIGALQAPSVVTISGAVDDCGFATDDDWPEWPLHPLDVDGDGVADTQQPRFSGWFSGETDLYSLTAEEAVSVAVELTWANAPSGDENAPYQPTEEGGPWSEESDLDWVVFAVVGARADVVVSDAGFGSAYPQRGPQRLLVEPGEPLAVAVGCHHELPTDYTLTLDIRGL